MDSRDSEGKSVAVIGLGALGEKLCGLLHEHRDTYGILNLYGNNRNSDKDLEKVKTLRFGGYPYYDFKEGEMSRKFIEAMKTDQIFSKYEGNNVADVVVVCADKGPKFTPQMMKNPQFRYEAFNNNIDMLLGFAREAAEHDYRGVVITASSPTDLSNYFMVQEYNRVADERGISHADRCMFMGFNHIDSKRLEDEVIRQLPHLQGRFEKIRAERVGEHGPNSMYVASQMMVQLGGVERQLSALGDLEDRMEDIAKDANKKAYEQIVRFGDTSRETATVIDYIVGCICNGKGRFVMSVPTEFTTDPRGRDRKMVSTGLPIKVDGDDIRVLDETVRVMTREERHKFNGVMMRTRATLDFLQENGLRYPEVKRYFATPLQRWAESRDLDKNERPKYVAMGGKTSSCAGILNAKSEKPYVVFGKTNRIDVHNPDTLEHLESLTWEEAKDKNNIPSNTGQRGKRPFLLGFESFAQIGNEYFALKLGKGIFRIDMRGYRPGYYDRKSSVRNMDGCVTQILDTKSRIGRLQTDGKNLHVYLKADVVTLDRNGRKLQVIEGANSPIKDFCVVENDIFAATYKHELMASRNGQRFRSFAGFDKQPAAITGALIDGKKRVFFAQKGDISDILEFEDMQQAGSIPINEKLRTLALLEASYGMTAMKGDKVEFVKTSRFDLVVGGQQHIFNFPIHIPDIGSRRISDPEDHVADQLKRDEVHEVRKRAGKFPSSSYRFAVWTIDRQGIWK